MEEHKFEVAVGITGLKIFLATTNPWLLAFGVVAVGSVAVVVVGVRSYVACKKKDQEREVCDRK